MITEDYVSFEIAKLLKEKGFDECPLFRYDDCRHLWVQGGYNKTIKWHFPAPTLQMAMKWLREIHGYVIVVEPGLSGDKYVWTYKVIFYRTRTMLLQHEDNVGSSTYEEAVETALKYCLNLI